MVILMVVGDNGILKTAWEYGILAAARDLLW